MKKTNTRVRHNGGSKSASSQVPNKPDAVHPDCQEITLEFLTHEDETIDLSVLTGAESEYVRIFVRNAKVSLADLAKDLLLRHIDASIAAAKPAAPVVVTNEAPVVSYRVMPPLKRENVVHEGGFDMEIAVWRAMAMLELLARQDCTSTERRASPHSGGMAGGMMYWADDLSRALHRDFYAANEAKHNGGDKITTVRKLANTVEKVHAMLMMLGHDLSSSDYSTTDKLGFEPPEDDIAPMLSLASDAIEYLKASFYNRFGGDLPMDQIDREINEELLLKFPQAQRRAA